LFLSEEEQELGSEPVIYKTAEYDMFVLILENELITTQLVYIFILTL
jgi:hypothetical protein